MLEQMMLRWINHHIRAYVVSNPGQSHVPVDFAVSDLSDDLADCAALAIILHQVAPAVSPCDLSALALADHGARAAKVVAHAFRGCNTSASEAAMAHLPNAPMPQLHVLP